ncbi:hypothetical protein BJ165DRAFT_1528981 [Panaeolus papilionaceus]|nr:hypothetical protein BJ165DRAFT_1528981 [Panaeolus papilionaceus]
MTDTSIADICKAFSESVQAELPYISGSFALGPSESRVFYQGPNGLGLLDLSIAAPADLEALSNACQPAPFGLGGENILDPSYRKAGKMDPASFATQFSPLNHGVVDVIKQDLLKDGDERGVGIELYKLNVYGPRSFFKAHVDTPRSENMFGSLVVVLPTVHEGGSLVFRHSGKEWTFDSANAVGTPAKSPDNVEDSSHSPPTLLAAFTAFYSDVEHEVAPVISGYRVTLTYNLYFADGIPTNVRGTASAVRSQSPATIAIQTHLSDLLSNPSFLTSGGNLGFKLVHKYPVHRSTDLHTLIKMLKGPDARILVACTSLGLKTSLQVFYTFKNYRTKKRYVTKKAINVDSIEKIDNDYWSETEMFLEGDCGAKMIRDVKLESVGELGGSVKRKKDTRDVYWVNPEVETGTKVESAYVAYGNEASLGYLYGDVAIVAEVGKPDARKTVA